MSCGTGFEAGWGTDVQSPNAWGEVSTTFSVRVRGEGLPKVGAGCSGGLIALRNLLPSLAGLHA